jgi:hypothetical protein
VGVRRNIQNLASRLLGVYSIPRDMWVYQRNRDRAGTGRDREPNEMDEFWRSRRAVSRAPRTHRPGWCA